MPVIGTQQSPIKIVSRKTLLTTFPPDYFEFDYPNRLLPGKFESENFKFLKPVPSVTFRGEKWNLHKIHIHGPAEHRIDETDAADFECHLVNLRQKDPCEKGEKLVIGVFFKIVDGLETLSSFSDIGRAVSDRLKEQQATDSPRAAKAFWPASSGGVSLRVNPVHFLPKNPEGWKTWFHYEGSLTSGTYSEDVSWFVLSTVAEVARADVDFLTPQADQHTRDVHATDRRFVLRNFGPAVLPTKV